jgi:FkbM family methyltransferase
MKKLFIQLLNGTLRISKVKPIQYEGTSLLQQLKTLRKYSIRKQILGVCYLKHSRSQLAQDLFVALELNFKKDGFFVEFGASDGITLNNSVMLETRLKWNGILAEPALMWHEKLKKNRNVPISTMAVWKNTGEILAFEEYAIGELNTLQNSKGNDGNLIHRNAQKNYLVETITLEKLLSDFDAPSSIDVIFIDTEGSEFEILSHFNFDSRDVKIFIVEHAFSDFSESLDALFSSKGYEKVHKDISAWDSWYVKKPTNQRIVK